MLDNMRRGRPFSFKGQLEMTDDPVDCLRLFDKRYDPHLATTGGAQQKIHFIDLKDQLGPAPAGDSRALNRVISLTRLGKNRQKTQEIRLKRKRPGDRMWGRARNILCSFSFFMPMSYSPLTKRQYILRECRGDEGRTFVPTSLGFPAPGEGETSGHPGELCPSRSR